VTLLSRAPRFEHLRSLHFFKNQKQCQKTQKAKCTKSAQKPKSLLLSLLAEWCPASPTTATLTHRHNRLRESCLQSVYGVGGAGSVWPHPPRICGEGEGAAEGGAGGGGGDGGGGGGQEGRRLREGRKWWRRDVLFGGSLHAYSSRFVSRSWPGRVRRLGTKRRADVLDTRGVAAAAPGVAGAGRRRRATPRALRRTPRRRRRPRGSNTHRRRRDGRCRERRRRSGGARARCCCLAKNGDEFRSGACAFRPSALLASPSSSSPSSSSSASSARSTSTSTPSDGDGDGASPRRRRASRLLGGGDYRTGACRRRRGGRVWYPEWYRANTH
jgi:hypothetical protein